ncbi:unnamed protein product, partial [Polarella glacialis]
FSGSWFQDVLSSADRSAFSGKESSGEKAPAVGSLFAPAPRSNSGPDSTGAPVAEAITDESFFTHSVCPVKNTFIHYEAAKQPDYRTARSGPAALQGSRAEEDEEAEEEAEEEAAAVEEPAPPESSAAPSRPNRIRVEEAPSNVAPVKNTFIHFDVETQPDYRSCRSGPGGVQRQVSYSDEGEDASFSVALAADANGAGSGIQTYGLPLTSVSVKNTFVHFSTEEQPDYQSFKSSPAALASAGQPAPNLPSKGSAGHGQGNCKPCAHNWKPGGCSKAWECTFCHLCEGDDFRRRRKEKLNRLKAERLQRQRRDGKDSDDLEESEPNSPTSHGVTSPKSVSFGAEHQETAVPMPVGPLVPVVGSQKPAREDDHPAPGELVVTYREDQGLVSWSVDLRRLRSQHRCGLSRRFAFRLGASGPEVPFVLFLLPASDQDEQTSAVPSKASSSFRKSELRAALQVKCTDSAALANELLSVSFAAGNLPARQASKAHDFTAEPVCALQSQEALWDLLAAALPGGNQCVIHVEIAANHR